MKLFCKISGGLEKRLKKDRHICVAGGISRKSHALAAVIAGICLAAGSARSQSWSPVNVPVTSWVCAAASADGVKLVVVGMDLIYTSTDAGAHWRLSYSNSLPWAAVASSWDGTKLVATGSQGNTLSGPIQGQIYTSVDSGTNWTPSLAPTNYWKALASSTDGTRLAAAVGGNFVNPGPIYTSSDSGTNWTPTTAPFETWYSLACSADGSKLIAAGIDAVYTSSDFGTNWLPATNLPAKPWTYACSSLDGTRLAVAAQPGVIYTSTNSGLTWNKSGSSSLSWNALACSADGTKLAAGCWLNHGIYMSADAGLTWQPTTSAAGNWTALVVSADGSKWLGVDFTNGVFNLQTSFSSTLNIAGSGSGAQLSWLLPSEMMGLEANSDLSTTNWTAVPDAPTLNLTNLQYYLNVAPAPGGHFYRLAH
jgi:hypothetical protein